MIPSAWILKHSIFARKNAMWPQLFKLEQNQMCLEELCRPPNLTMWMLESCFSYPSKSLQGFCILFWKHFLACLHARFLSKLKDPFNITCKPFVIWIKKPLCVTLEVLCGIGPWTFLNLEPTLLGYCSQGYNFQTRGLTLNHKFIRLHRFVQILCKIWFSKIHTKIIWISCYE